MSTPYEALFAVGEHVRIKPRDALERFRANWKYHNALTSQQLEFGGMQTSVKKIGFYHGGDPLYELQDADGVWHEDCLEGDSC